MEIFIERERGITLGRDDLADGAEVVGDLVIGVAVRTDARLQCDDGLVVLGALDVPKFTNHPVPSSATTEERNKVFPVTHPNTHSTADPATRAATKALGGTAAHQAGVQRRYRDRGHIG